MEHYKQGKTILRVEGRKQHKGGKKQYKGGTNIREGELSPSLHTVEIKVIVTVTQARTCQENRYHQPTQSHNAAPATQKRKSRSSKEPLTKAC